MKNTEAAAAPLPSNTEKDPDTWTTGDEEFDANLSKAEASKRIDALQARTGRGRDH